MDLQGIVAQLRQEANRIERAIAALVGFGSPSPRRGRPPKASQAAQVTGRRRRRLSAAARAKIAAAMRARRAKQKAKAPSKKAKSAQKKRTGRP